MLDHVQLAAPKDSEEQARAFYAGLLHMEEVEKPLGVQASGGVWFQSHAAALHLGIEEPFHPAKKAHPGLTFSQLDDVAVRLQTAGYPVQFDDRLAPRRRFFTKDPFGNRIECIEQQIPAVVPKRLTDGSHVRLLAPASSLATVESNILDGAIEVLQSLGLCVSISQHARAVNPFGSSDPACRLEDLHTAFADPTIDAILCVRGGFSSNELLDGLDYELIRRNPKILCGFSDITALSQAIFTKSGLVTYSGPMLRALASRDAYTLQAFRNMLFEDKTMTIQPSHNWHDHVDGKDVTLPNPGHLFLSPGTAAGRLLGGNLCTLNLLQGTAYFPDLRDSILFLEDDYEVHPATFARDFASLMAQPGADSIRGIVFGRFQLTTRMTDEHLQYLVQLYPSLSSIPVIAGADFGHTMPLFTFPIGGTAQIEDGKISIGH
ncbi:LD-carboxypeptidase [Exiguobacterium antarcticum]|uniref:LD-carboxypeptidase n=1 Tax=Exiguobacterium antarcticum TaxID=132920 RepID=A0ABT6R562_9BACL|nr:LD-carboxypeptidase [Exiguobacterium antarcticum]MDI3236072.1 LD-carboxypeptidase [Exiguobacterium antarcticum]